MKVFQKKPLGKDFFGEGATVYTAKDGSLRVQQMTWKKRKIFEYDGKSLELIKTMDLPKQIQEGWGLTNRKVDGETKFFVTDGTSNVYQVNPENWAIEKTTQVKNRNGHEIKNLNDIEFYNGYLLANVYLTPYIAVIDLDSGVMDK